MHTLTPKQIYEMAQRGDWNNIPYDELSLEDINYHNQSYETILHLAAYRASLSSFPERLLTHNNLSKRDTWSNSVYFLAAERENISGIPHKLLTKKLLTRGIEGDDEGYLMILISKNILDCVPSHILTKDILLTTVDNPSNTACDGKTFAHQIAFFGMMKHVDKKLLDKETLSCKDQEDMRVVDYMARAGQLELVNKKLIDNEMLGYKNHTQGTTLVHNAAQGGCIKALPAEGLYDEMFTQPDAMGENAIEKAMHSKCLNQISMKILTWKNLNVEAGKKSHKHSYAKTLWQKFVLNYTGEENEENKGILTNILRNIPNHKFNEINYSLKLFTHKNPTLQNVKNEIKKEIVKRRIHSDFKERGFDVG